jgi:hypothetical protein
MKLADTIPKSFSAGEWAAVVGVVYLIVRGLDNCRLAMKQ